ncbi:MAG: hypothetical protein JST00_03045 [Deltaproteobacteria bacterium]|nr:hypothetical protein [Deltaproteobacteria bacterium]
MAQAGKPHSARVRFARLAALGVVPLALMLTRGTADAQIAGTNNQPLPNVLLLVDTSGSMERMPDNSLPSDNRNPATGAPLAAAPYNACQPGVQSNPNRWGMLLQALTGNLQPYFSCAAVDRATAGFQNEFKINDRTPYDYQYFLPYHRPLAGNAAANACAFAPYTLPGAPAGSGVGPARRGSGTDASVFLPDSFVSVLNSHLTTQYAGNSALINELTMAPAGNGCLFDQANDGQLDATRDYIRFGLMTFDNATEAGTGLNAGPNPPIGLGVDINNPFLGQWTYVKSPANPDPIGFGLPGGCAGPPTPFDVGARHWSAPPWEGRMIPFPNPDGTLFDIQRANEQIQQVLLGTRPYGATPIDGMMEDARDYLWYNDYGPNGSQVGYKDDYVQASCREQYIILLTDGAPNLNLRPSCEAAGGTCPYPTKAADIARAMQQAIGGRHVKTFVIGFSVNGATNTASDGFPPIAALAPPNNNCKAWYQNVGGTPSAMRTACTTPPLPPAGSTAEACCTLNEIAYWGSGNTVGPFFAETQADLVLSFGRILGNVSKSATTRTIPGYSPPVTISSVARNAQFIASFIPNAQKVWSGEIDRTRNVCVGPTPAVQPQLAAEGDSMAANLAAQAGSNRRLFLSVEADPMAGPIGSRIDSQRTIRPLMSAHGGLLPAHPNDVALASGTPKSGIGMALGTALNIDAFGITNNTCKRSRDVTGATIPALNATDCTDVIWRFASASTGNPPYGGYSGWNVRCRGAASATNGTCSVSGAGCAVGASPSTCPTGEVCVPECSALGAIYRSSPTLVGAPGELLRDEAYRRFSDLRSKRRPTMFVSTTDGVLHAFKALAGPSFTGDSAANEHELWAFVPPAVLPKLASNYPTGQQILLDGTPAVADIVWDRRLGDPTFNLPEQFHTTLAAGMGAGGGGYFALNVTDVDCQGNSGLGIAGAPQGCLGGYAPQTAYNTIRQNPAGPSFLWQITDIEAISPGEKAKVTRTSPNGRQMVSLFGKESGNPVVTTLNVDPDGGGVRQVGVVILPGGIDGAPVQGGSCQRAIYGGGPTGFPADTDASDPGRAPRNSVRQWATGPCNSAPVPGRSVTIVRADTGAIIRHFGRIEQDTPQGIRLRTTDSPFDSPIIGTPAIFPNQTGISAQKIYVGDADGTLWRIDVSSSDPTRWRVQLFQDLVSRDHVGSPGAAQSQPIQVPPLVTLDPVGNTIVIAATGDQEAISTPAPGQPDKNYLFSIQETRGLSGSSFGPAQLRWFTTFSAGQRVTGPMTVFDRVLYFATFTPIIPNAATCSVGGNPLVWGLDFYNPEGGTPLSGLGGVPRWCPLGSVDAVTGACTAPAPLPPNQDPSAGPFGDPQLRGAIIAGVTIRSSLPCVQSSGGTDPALGGMSSTKYDLFFGATTRGTGGAGTGTPQAARPASAMTRPLPRTTANIDAWSLVTD